MKLSRWYRLQYRVLKLVVYYKKTYRCSIRDLVVMVLGFFYRYRVHISEKDAERVVEVALDSTSIYSMLCKLGVPEEAIQPSWIR